jgi:integrase
VILGTKTELPTRKLALRKLEPYLAKINSVEYHPRSTMTLAEIVARWASEAKAQYKPGTWRNFQGHLRLYLLPYFGTTQLDNMQTEVVQHFISDLNLKGKPAVVRSILKTFRVVWKTARAWGYVRHDPFTGLMLPKLHRVESKWFSEEDLRRIIAAAEEPDRTLYWLAAQTGLRIGELLALTWADVDLVKGILSVRASIWEGTLQSTKTAAADRALPLSRKLQQHLLAYRQNLWRQNDMQLLFPNGSGKPCRSSGLLERKLQPLLERLGIRRAGFHAFRHANATLLDRMNSPMKIRQQRLGHSKAEMTLSLYTHVADEDARAVAERFDDYLALSCPSAEPVVETTEVNY